MHETLILTIVILFGMVVPGVVFGCILNGYASYGRTAVATASWAVCTASIAIYRYATHGVDSLTVVAVMTTLLALLWTYGYRSHLMPAWAGTYIAGGRVDRADISRQSVAAVVSPSASTHDPDSETTTSNADERKEL